MHQDKPGQGDASIRAQNMHEHDEAGITDRGYDVTSNCWRKSPGVHPSPGSRQTPAEAEPRCHRPRRSAPASDPLPYRGRMRGDECHAHCCVLAKPGSAISGVAAGQSARPPSRLQACVWPRRRNARATCALRLPERQKKTSGVCVCASQFANALTTVEIGTAWRRTCTSNSGGNPNLSLIHI